MPYPPPIITMAEHLPSPPPPPNPLIGERNPYMLWNAVLFHHFPLTQGYAIVPPHLDFGFFLVNKLGRAGSEAAEDVVLAVLPTNRNLDQMNGVQTDLANYIRNHCFAQTQYKAVYGIATTGLAWSTIKVDRAGSDQHATSEVIVPTCGGDVASFGQSYES